MATWLQSLGNLNNNLTDKFMAGGIGKGLGSLGITSGGLGGIANTIGNMATGLLAGQNQTGVGNIMQTVGGLASNIPGVGGLIGAGVSVVGGLVNAAFGSHINEEFVNQTNQQANALGSTVFNANTNGDLLNDWQNMTQQSNVSKSDVGSDGWFSNKAQNKTNELNARINEANRRQLANFGIAAQNVDTQNDFRILQNMAAYGGPIGSFRKFYAKGGYLEQAKALIRQNEGFRDKPYSDAPKGKNWRSVGYGFNDSGFRDKYPEGISKHYERGITKKQAEEELDYFLKGAEKQLKNIYGGQWNSFTDSQKAAILDTYYQRPASVGKTSRFYKAVTAGEDPSRYLGVAGFTKRNNIRQNVFGGGEFTGVGYSDEYNPNGETGEITYPSSSSLLEATSPYLDLSGVTPTQAVNPTINLPTLDTNFLASFGQSQPAQQAVPTVGTVEDYLQAYGDNLDANMIFAHGGFLGKKFDGEGEESQYLQVQRSPHVDLAVNNPWLYQKLHPAQRKAEKYEPTTFAGRITQLAGASELGQKYADYTSSAIQQVPVVGLVPSALDLGYDANRLYHNHSLTTTKDVTLDAASLVPALRKTMKGWWMKGNSGQFVTEAGQVINNPRVASSFEVALQPFRTAINTGVYAGRVADFVDDSKAYLKDMYNDSPIGKHFPIKANGGRLITKDRFDMNMFDFGGGLTHGSEFDTGINWVNEGGSHSENPLGGVPMGVDEEGVPNLVEQDEAIWNGDYVFSKRMKVPKKLRDKYKLPEGSTFADAVAKLTKESEERPLDEISRATQDHILGEFADSQEEMRMAKAQRAMDREMQLRDDFITGFNIGAFGGSLFRDGGGIHIDPSKKGTFKAQASKMGMGVQEAASHILANKEDYSPAMVKKANFAKNFAHAFGGSLFDDPFGEANIFDLGGEIRTLIDKLKKNDLSDDLIDEWIYKNKPEWRTEYFKNYRLTDNWQTGTDGIKYVKPRAATSSRAENNGGSNSSSATQTKSSGTGFAETAKRSVAGRTSGTATPNRGNIVDFAYDWYRNGSDGLGEPTGFKVGKNGRAYDYTKEYTDLVNRLGADDIRAWAAEHPNDPSLKSFLAKGNKLEDLKDEQWRKGATDGKYGFMHHVADNMLNNASFNPPEIEREPASTSAITDAVRQAIARDGYTSEPTAQDADIVNALTPDTAIGGKSFNPRPTWMRQVPIWLSGIMGLRDMLTPADYSNADAITEAAYQSGQPVSVGTEYIGDYRKRDPFDQHYLENIINQRGAATNRNMMNFSGGNRAVGMAGILANDLVTQQGLAEAARQGYIANRTDDAQVSEFNRGTNLANMQAQNTRNLALAQLNSQRKNAMLSGIAQGARLRQAIKDQRDAAISANLTNFAQGLGDWGKENGFYNMLGGLNEEGVLKYFFGDNYKTRFNNTSNV